MLASLIVASIAAAPSAAQVGTATSVSTAEGHRVVLRAGVRPAAAPQGGATACAGLARCLGQDRAFEVRREPSKAPGELGDEPAAGALDEAGLGSLERRLREVLTDLARRDPRQRSDADVPVLDGDPWTRAAGGSPREGGDGEE